jgi:hypothetical protein
MLSKRTRTLFVKIGRMVEWEKIHALAAARMLG